MIIKSGSVSTANGKIERASTGSPSVLGGGGSEDGGRLIFGFREGFVQLLVMVSLQNAKLYHHRRGMQYENRDRLRSGPVKEKGSNIHVI